MAKKTSAVIKVEKFLIENKSNIKTVHLDESARSAQEAAKSLDTSEGSIVKSLLFKVNDMGIHYPVMALISGDKKGNEQQILLSSGYKGKLSRPDAEYVKKITGFSIGGVSPLTISKNIPILIDDNLKRFDLKNYLQNHHFHLYKVQKHQNKNKIKKVYLKLYKQ